MCANTLFVLNFTRVFKCLQIEFYLAFSLTILFAFDSVYVRLLNRALYMYSFLFIWPYFHFTRLRNVFSFQYIIKIRAA